MTRAYLVQETIFEGLIAETLTPQKRKKTPKFHKKYFATISESWFIEFQLLKLFWSARRKCQKKRKEKHN